jgi:NAD(P)-dependent dehydrogenase (short-subunit alcohol dehydrogenase family)
MAAHLFNLSDKTALVTGGSRGIGASIARGLLEAGAEVFITARKADDCDAMARELATYGPCHSLPCDISTVAAISELSSELAVRTPKLDILVNNAGVTSVADIQVFPEGDWDNVLNINLKSAFFLVQGLLPLLKAAASKRDPSRIINIGSVAGLVALNRDNYAYSASKAGLHHLTRQMGRRLASDYITVNAIAPGAFETRMITYALEQRAALEAEIPLGKIGGYEDIAGAAVFLASPAGAYVTASVLAVDGGFSLIGK